MPPRSRPAAANGRPGGGPPITQTAMPTPPAPVVRPPRSKIAASALESADGRARRAHPRRKAPTSMGPGHAPSSHLPRSPKRAVLAEMSGILGTCTSSWWSPVAHARTCAQFGTRAATGARPRAPPRAQTGFLPSAAPGVPLMLVDRQVHLRIPGHIHRHFFRHNLTVILLFSFILSTQHVLY